MELTFTARLKQAWNAFLNNKDPTVPEYRNIGSSYATRPDRPRLTPGNERSIITSVVNRIAMDAASVKIRHVRQDEEERYLETINSGLNNCLSLEANVDQTGRAFIQDVVMSMLDEGVVAIVPVDTSIDPRTHSTYDIRTMRTGKIVDWYPQHVKVRLYNDRTGRKEELIFPKTSVGIVENPLYAVMNEKNSTLQRLVRKLNLLDVVDEQSGSGKLDLIIQLPYVIKNEARKEQAEKRRKDIEAQLAGSKYGIAYTDGTEKITQLNRQVENNLMSQIEYLTSMLYSQLGINQVILDGTADMMSMQNYNNRTIEPILSAITDEMKRKFLTKTARTQGQSIKFFIDPFRYVTVTDLATAAQSILGNGIMAPNEFRPYLGLKPADNPDADMMYNRNITQPEMGYEEQYPEDEEYTDESDSQELQNSALAHHGVEGQKWGIRNGPPYPLSQEKTILNKVEKFNNFMNTEMDYGVLHDGKRLMYDDGSLNDFNWDNYRTMPVEKMKKEKIGTCWDFVNLQHDYFKQNDIPDHSYLFFAQREDGSYITHTFSVIELDGKPYWFESSLWKYRGVTPVNNVNEIFDKISDTYGSVKYSFFEEYDPEGMDQNLTDKEFINRIVDK